MILDIEKRTHELCISYFDKEGDVAFINLPVPNEDRFVWEECDENDREREPDYSTWNGKPVKKQYMRTAGGLNKYRINELMVKYADQLTPLNDFNTPKKYFVDIEVEVIDGFPSPEEAQNRVTTIGIANSSKRAVTVLGIKELSEEDCVAIEKNINEHFKKFNETWTFRYYYYESEYNMMYAFFKDIVPRMPCISGWNFTNYDWKYLLNRVEKINQLQSSRNRIRTEWASPADKLMGQYRFPVHRLIVDYLEIYKKWDKVIKQANRESDKLDHVGSQAVGIEKIKYSGSIKDLYEKDFVKYVFYNAVDCVLVHYIDKKINTMSTYLKLGHVAMVEAKKAFSPIWMMEALMCREFLKDKKVFIHSYDREFESDEDEESFDGAHVVEPLTGFHEWVTCYDFASLYPNTMMQFNISPETFVDNNIEPKEGEIKVGLHDTLSGQTVWRVFRNNEDSILRNILKEMYKKRKDTKQKYLSINKEIDILKRHLAGDKQLHL